MTRRTAPLTHTMLALLLALAAACAPADEVTDAPAPSAPPPSRPARFAVIGEGSARDTQTGLEWTSHDQGRDVLWHDAEAYCSTLDLGSKTDWRLPEIEELRALYDESASQPCAGDRTCRLDPAIDLTGQYVWSGTENAPARRVYMDFRLGTSLAPVLKPGLVRRALCVRQDPA